MTAVSIKSIHFVYFCNNDRFEKHIIIQWLLAPELLNLQPEKHRSVK